MAQDAVTALAELLEGKGRRRYGLSDVNQLQHALQAAMLVEQAGCNAALVTAALLHDVGHMVHNLGENPAEEGIDDRHEEIGRAYLATLFGPEVTEPVRLHVPAKRYPCATEPDYFAKLSADQCVESEAAGRPDVVRRSDGVPCITACRCCGAAAAVR
jgi:predicted HD phosphohydrolase